MKALNFIKSLLPSFAKSSVLEDCRMTKLVLVTTVQPTYEASLRLFNGRKFENAQLRADWDRYRHTVQGASGPNTIVAIEKTLKNMVSTLDMIEQLVERDYNEDIVASGISYYKASVLQMQESIHFAAEYALKYLNYVCVVETAAIESDEDNGHVSDIVAQAITPAEFRYLSDRFADFCIVMNTLTKPSSAVKQQLEKVPDIAVTDEGDKVVQHTIGDARLNPFKHDFVSARFNPIYHIRLQFANWQVGRVNEAKALKEMLELRVLRMKRAQEGKNDPQLEREIEHTQKRLDDARAFIRQKEMEYA